jgi:hypothetical protein
LTVANRRRRARNGTEMARPVRTTRSRLGGGGYQLGRWVRRVLGDHEPRWQGPPARASRQVGFEAASTLVGRPRSWAGRYCDLGFLRTRRDRSCSPVSADSRCDTDPAWTGSDPHLPRLLAWHHKAVSCPRGALCPPYPDRSSTTQTFLFGVRNDWMCAHRSLCGSVTRVYYYTLTRPPR